FQKFSCWVSGGIDVLRYIMLDCDGIVGFGIGVCQMNSYCICWATTFLILTSYNKKVAKSIIVHFLVGQIKSRKGFFNRIISIITNLEPILDQDSFYSLEVPAIKEIILDKNMFRDGSLFFFD